ncbi:helix-turn-helix domain-containing protein [Streptomyces olivaceoviridis]|uniref:helix-turn-helix domain-containing protein n=1 Tax=Streptomyces olivaceoviridis TaxID=1921 RepID=UPI0037AC12D3
MIVTVQYTPPDAPHSDSLHLQLHAEPGARLTVRLSTPALTSADIPVPTPPSPHDWDLPGLPADCAPGRVPDLLTDAQAAARLRYGYDQGWTQRRIAAFAGRGAATVHRHVERFRAESKK